MSKNNYLNIILFFFLCSLGYITIFLMITRINNIKINMIFNSIIILLPAVSFHLSFYGNLKKITSKNARYIYLYLGIFILLVSTPILNYLSLYSEVLFKDLDFFKTSTINYQNLLLEITSDKTSVNILINTLSMAILPAISEEILFRGTIQNIVLKKINNHHLSIIITSIIFSILHFNFKTLLPIIFLSVILGYSFYYGKSILIPISIHFINNAISLISLYHERENFFYLKNPSVIFTIISLIAILLSLYFLKKYNKI